jgi:uncharacterized protein YoxC
MPAKSVTQAECKNNMSTIMEKIDQLFNKISDLSIKVEGIPQKVLENADERYASKRIEQTVDKLIWLVVSAVVVAGLAIILK